MNLMLNKAWSFAEVEEGATAIEYAVLLAAIFLVCFVAIQAVGAKTNTLMSRVVDKGGL